MKALNPVIIDTSVWHYFESVFFKHRLRYRAEYCWCGKA